MADIETSADQGSRHIRVITPDRAWGWLNLRELWLNRAFLYILVWRDLKVRYKQTVVGLAWVLFEPLAMTMIFTIFLGYLVRVPSDDLPYPDFV